MPRVGGYLGQGGDELLGGGLVPGGADHGQLGAGLNREALPLPKATPPSQDSHVAQLWDEVDGARHPAILVSDLCGRFKVEQSTLKKYLTLGMLTMRGCLGSLMEVT